MVSANSLILELRKKAKNQDLRLPVLVRRVAVVVERRISDLLRSRERTEYATASRE